MGDKLGYYRALAEAARSTPGRLAERTGTGEHYAREWLNAQAAGGFVELRPGDRRVHAAAPSTRSRSPTRPARPSCPASSRSRSAPSTTPAASSTPRATATGVGWHEHNHDVHDGCERFFRPGYHANLVGRVAAGARRRRRQARARGAASPTSAAATARRRSSWRRRSRAPRSSARTTTRASIETARAARRRGRGRRPGHVRGGAGARRSRGTGYDLVTIFDALHDMGDPVGAARHVRQALADDGTWMVVEPMAGDHVEDNLNPVGRAYYGFSTLLCTPASLSQDVGLALGTQAGPARIRDVVDRRAASPGSARSPRRRSTRCWRSGRDGARLRRGHGPGTGPEPGSRPRPRPASSSATASALAYDVYGAGRTPTLLLMPTWSIVHSRIWKAQVAYLARHFRVVTFDGRGSGASDRPVGCGRLHRRGVRRRHARRAGRDRDRPGRAGGLLVRRRPGRCTSPPTTPTGCSGSSRSRRPAGSPCRQPARDQRAVGRSRPDAHRGLGEVQPALLARGRLRRLPSSSSSARCSPSRTRPSRSRTASAGRHEITPQTLVDTTAGRLGCDGAVCAAARAAVRRACAARCWSCTAPTTAIRPHAIGERLAELTGGALVLLDGAGHGPPARDPVRVNHLIARLRRPGLAPRRPPAGAPGCAPRRRPRARALPLLARSGSATRGATSPSPTSCASCTPTSRSTGSPSTR